MRSYKNKIIIILTVFTIVFSLFPSTTAIRTVGIGPSIIDFSNVFRFGEYERTVFIYNGNDYETNFSLLISVKFVSFYI